MTKIRIMSSNLLDNLHLIFQTLIFQV